MLKGDLSEYASQVGWFQSLHSGHVPLVNGSLGLFTAARALDSDSSHESVFVCKRLSGDYRSRYLITHKSAGTYAHCIYEIFNWHLMHSCPGL